MPANCFIMPGPSSSMSCCWTRATTNLAFGRQRRRAAGVLGMVVRGDQVELGVLAHLRRLAQDGLHVARAEAGVDDQRRPAADDDAGVRDHADVAIRNDVDVGGDLDVAFSLTSGGAAAAAAARQPQQRSPKPRGAQRRRGEGSCIGSPFRSQVHSDCV